MYWGTKYGYHEYMINMYAIRNCDKFMRQLPLDTVQTAVNTVLLSYLEILLAYLIFEEKMVVVL